MKPFDLEATKRGDKVVTRNGLPVRILCYDADISRLGHKCQIAAIVGAGIDAYVAVFDNDSEQLYMAPKKVKRWLVTFSNEKAAREATAFTFACGEVEEVEVEE